MSLQVIRPQPGRQEQFLSSAADIAIFGGGAGGGKSWALLLEGLRHTGNSQFGAVIFRRTSPQITNEGALWDEAGRLYIPIGATPKVGSLEFKFPAGSTIGFAHLQHETTKFDWQGSQIPFIGFDELTHFEASQFWYLLSRNRSMCGVKPYVRATCNPDPDSWVAEFISWWIDQDTGFPIPERAGVLRWFVRQGEKLLWADRPEDLPQGADYVPKSVTFIPSLLSDNPALMAADPGYRANLLAMPPVERARLLGGNWKVRHGNSFFDLQTMLVDGKPVQPPKLCDFVFAVLDTAVKDRVEHDGTAVSYFARSQHFEPPLTLLDWDLVQIEGALLESWLPSVFRRLEELARQCGARSGSIGVFIEDKASGTILLQQARNRGWPAHSIDSKLTAAGKSERALSVSGYVHNGKLKISEHAYHKTTTFRDRTRNHWIGQVVGFQLGGMSKEPDDLLDTCCYGVAITFGNSEGY